MARRIFIDLDGVIADWEGLALKVVGAENDSQVKAELKTGKDIEDIFPDSWDRISAYNGRFWEELEVLPWGQQLYDTASKYGDVAFLTSGGNVHKRTEAVSQACAGKTRWVAKYFPGANLILTREKHLCASPISLLIDDTKKKIEQFTQYGGHTFHWPHPNRIRDGDVNLPEVIRDLERKITMVPDPTDV